MNIDGGALLDRGMQLARDGRWDEARNVFLEVAAEDRGNLEVWLWLAAIATDPQDSVAYLGQAMLINPNSVRAQKGMEWAKARLAPPDAPAEFAPKAESASSAPPATDVVPTLSTSSLDDAFSPLSPVAEAGIPSDSPSPISLVGPERASPAEDESVTGAAGETETPSVPATTSEIEWQGGQSFTDEGLSPVSVVDTDEIDTSSVPLASEAVPPAFSVSPRVLPDQGIALPSQPEESPLTVSLFDAPPGGEADSQMPEGNEESASPGESWETIIARLRAMDEQFPLEDEVAVSSGDAGGALGDPAIPATSALAPVTPAPPAADVPAAPLVPDVLEDLPAVTAPDDLEDSPAATASDVPEALPAAPVSDASSVSSSPPEAAFVETMPARPEAQVSAVGPAESTDGLVSAAKEHLEAGRVEEARRILRHVLELAPGNLEACEQLGVAEYQSGNLSESIAAFESVVASKPEHAEAHANLGFLYAEQGDTDKAITAFRDALSYNSGLVEAHLSLADLYKAQGKIDEAIEAWTAVAQLRPEFAEVHHSLGEAYAGRGQLSEAIWELRLVVDRKPDDARAHLRLGELLQQVGRSSDAAREYREAVRLSPGLAEAHYGLASCAEEQQDWDEAVAQLERALAVRPDYPEADERLKRLRDAMAAQQEQPAEEEKVAQEKKSRWFVFKRDKK